MKSFFTTLIFMLLFLASTFIASSAQINWTKDSNNPVLSGGTAGTWNRHVFGPCVLYNDDSLRYEMWFTASVGPPDWFPYCIGFATSPDGITWAMHETPILDAEAGTWDESNVAGAVVLREIGKYKMWYNGPPPPTV
jgi:hypothetical protein